MDQPYVIADSTGACHYATPAALDLLGLDASGLRQLRVDDLSGQGMSGDELRACIEASRRYPGRWLAGTVNIPRPHAPVRTVSFALIRRESGEIMLRLADGLPASGDPSVRDILETWRQQEVAASKAVPGTPEQLVAEAEIERLSAEYQRVALEVARRL